MGPRPCDWWASQGRRPQRPVPRKERAGLFEELQEEAIVVAAKGTGQGEGR